MRFSLEPADRPCTVAWFEQLGILLVALWTIEKAFYADLQWDDFVVAAIALGIVLSVSRGRSAVGRWVFTVLAALSLAVGAYDLAAAPSELENLSTASWAYFAVTLAGTIAQLWLAWSVDTSRWIRG